MAAKLAILCSASLIGLAAAGSPAFAQTAVDDGQDTGADIVVTGVRASMIQALEVKRDSTQVVESVVAEDVGKLPDNNVVEALQRLSGVQVTNRGGGETGTLSIRGLPDPLTTMNGREIFTAAGRSFALQDIAATLVKRIDVYKTRAADQIETGLAGQIDVQTRRPFDFDGFALSATGRGIYNETSDTLNPNVSLLVSDRWETGVGDIGLMVNGSYARTKYRDMSITAGALVPFVTENPPAGTGFTPLQRVFPETGAWQPGLDRGLPTEEGSTFVLNGIDTPYYLARDAVFSPDVRGDRKRPSVNAALQWSPNSSSVYTAEFFWTGFRQTTFNNLFFSFVDWWGSLGPNPADTITLYPGTNIIKTRTVGDVFGFNSGDITKSKTDSFVYALNGQWEVGDSAHISADLAYQDSKNQSQFFAMRTTRVAPQIMVDFNTGNGYPSYNFSDNSVLADPSAWTVGELYDNADKSSGSAWTFRLDGKKDFDGGFLRQVKAGIRYDNRKAASSVRGQDAPALNVPFTSLPEGAQYLNHGFFNGRASVPTSWVVANGYYNLAHADEIRELYRSTVDPGILLSDDLTMTRVFDINEITMSAYIQADGELTIFGRPLRLQAGLRYTDVDTDVTFTDRYSLVTTRGSSGTWKFLPSATAIFDVTDKLRLRFNYGKTLRRPAFGDLNSNFNLTGDLTQVGYGSGSAGNPNLRSTQSTNYDLSLEWYFDRDSAIYTTLFRREVDGLVVPITSLVQVPGTGLNTDTFLVTRPQNASNGVLKGIELGALYFPDYLPGILRGLGVQGSMTILDSKQNIPQVDIDGNVIGQDSSPFFGVSDLSYNVTLAYDRKPVGVRLSYVWRKNFLSNNEARLFANPIGVWRVPEKSLDLQVTLDVTKRLGITFDATNLTNEVQQSYYRFGDAGGFATDNLGSTLLSRTFALGVRYSFN
ncbi:TonB-dependent receptor [Hephaestia caeni]|uniref:TonB-dependent receptor n=1 Tax=Hephaestia caeni TaxID=645617 RepID=A0A397NTT2_9SPHN|nr:TonB-dependent receptor [Hephaestia caeni]RIA37114.1 TonB-dependent receptor [Hephaestia caeni]